MASCSWRVRLLDGAFEVLDGEELAALGDDGDADGVDVGVEEVAAMAGGVHPGVLDLERGGAFGDVFGDDAEAGTGGGGTLGEFMLSCILVGYVVVGKHDTGVDGGGVDEGGIAAERGETEGGALLVRRRTAGTARRWWEGGRRRFARRQRGRRRAEVRTRRMAFY